MIEAEEDVTVYANGRPSQPRWRKRINDRRYFASYVSQIPLNIPTYTDMSVIDHGLPLLLSCGDTIGSLYTFIRDFGEPGE